MLYNKLMQLQGHKQIFTQLRNLRVYIVKEVLLSEFVPYDSGSHPSHTLPGTRLGMSSWSIAKGKSKSGNIQMFSLSLFSSVQSLSHVWLFAPPWTAACQASLSIINSRSLPKPMSIESMMPSNYLILCHPLLLLPSIFPSIRVFSNESALHIN